MLNNVATQNPLLAQPVKLGFVFMNASWPGSPVVENTVARITFIGALHHAMDNGVRIFDTSDIYAPSFEAFGHNEILLAEAVATWSGTEAQKAELILATKGGITRAAGEVWGRNASAQYLVSAAAASAARLNVEVIPVWQHHRLDPNRTFSEALAGLSAVKASGLARNIGVSNYSATQLKAAYETIGGPADGGLVSVQNQLNPAYRHDLDVIQVCEELDLAFLPWTPMKGARPKEAGTQVFELLSEVAAKHGVSTFAVANAWLRSLSPNVVPMPGVTRIESIDDHISALQFNLSEEDKIVLASLPASEPVDAEIIADQPKSWN
jgi:aryl-alcohol dehydrogenase-like predicted oxidoreductase